MTCMINVVVCGCPLPWQKADIALCEIETHCSLYIVDSMNIDNNKALSTIIYYNLHGMAFSYPFFCIKWLEHYSIHIVSFHGYWRIFHLDIIFNAEISKKENKEILISKNEYNLHPPCFFQPIKLHLTTSLTNHIASFIHLKGAYRLLKEYISYSVPLISANQEVFNIQWTNHYRYKIRRSFTSYFYIHHCIISLSSVSSLPWPAASGGYISSGQDTNMDTEITGVYPLSADSSTPLLILPTSPLILFSTFCLT